ncbi:hypothetical protein Tco_1456953 [Tanacetum coccineum]
MFRETPVISAGFQAKISKFCLSKEHSSLRPFSVNVDPMATVCSGVIVPPSTRNFNILYDVDGTARIFLMPGLPIIALCWDDDLITMKFIHAEVSGGTEPLDPLSLCGEFYEANVIQDFEDARRSIYTLCTNMSAISTSMIIGPSVPSSSLRGGKDIAVSEEKLWGRREITVVILVRDRCPRGKGNLPRSLEWDLRFIRIDVTDSRLQFLGFFCFLSVLEIFLRSIRIHIEQGVATMKGYRGEVGDIEVERNTLCPLFIPI